MVEANTDGSARFRWTASVNNLPDRSAMAKSLNVGLWSAQRDEAHASWRWPVHPVRALVDQTTVPVARLPLYADTITMEPLDAPQWSIAD